MQGLVVVLILNAQKENGLNLQETLWAARPTSSQSQAAMMAGSSFLMYQRCLRLADGSQACKMAMPVDHKFGLVSTM